VNSPDPANVDTEVHDSSDGRPGGVSHLPLALVLAAMASAGAGLVHAAAAGTHNGDTALTTLFAITAAVQLGWAALVAARPTRDVAIAGVVLGVVAAGAWVLSRTAGLPVIASLSETEPVGTQDALAAVLGGLSAVFAGIGAAGVRMPRTLLRVPLGAVGAVALLALAVPGVAAQHTHGPSHDHTEGHGHGDEVAHEAGHQDGHGEHVEAVGEAGHHAEAGHHGNDAPQGGGYGQHDGEEIISLSDPRLTDEEREAAQKLIDDTTAGMARFSTVESVEAAGYRSIGDGGTGWEHFVNYGNIIDGVDLDPNAIESIVFKVYPDDTKQLASAMYILGPGSTMADAPDIAGDLTVWHDHQDLCWEGGNVVAILDADGNCSRGAFRPTPPMLHVWMIPHRCGPFAGIESGGHGDGCGHDHQGDEEGGEPAARREDERAAGS
jgi:hypothetical protein